MRKIALIFPLLVLSIFVGVSLEPVSAIVPEIRDIKPYIYGPDTWLNITIYHFPETPSTDTVTGEPGHFVDMLRVTVNGNATEQTIGPVINAPQTNTFVWQYNLGHLPSDSTITVTAHCSVNGWGPTSAAVSASASSIVPEYPTIALLAMLLLIVTFTSIVAKRTLIKNK